MIKINMGCWTRDWEGWVNIDQCDLPHIHYHDVTQLEFESNSVDLIYASHVIAYFDRKEIVPVLEEWKRVLKPNGILRLATPDFGKIQLMYSNFWGLEHFLGLLYGKMEFGENKIYHKTVYDDKHLIGLLREVGFENIEKYDWKDTEHSHYDDHSQCYLPHMDKENGMLMSLNIQCRK